MVRLGKSFACTLVAGVALASPSVARCQTTAPSAPVTMAPQANPAFSRPQPAQGTFAPNVAAAPGSATASQAMKPHTRRTKGTPVAEAAPSTPPPPPTLEQQAPVAP